MAGTPSSALDVSIAVARPPGAARLTDHLRSKLRWQRVVFALVVCLIVSTQAFFQPTLYTPFDAGGVAWTWLDYLGECLLMGVPIMVTVTLGEVIGDRAHKSVALAIFVVAVALGATVGALLLIPYYDAEWTTAFDGRFVSDVVYWSLIASGIAAIYALQQRAAVSAAAAHQAQIDRIAFSKQMVEAQLQVMRAQIEPHFLFNTLANVKRLAQMHVDDGTAMLDNLVRYLHAALPRMREDHTTLGQEAELARAYLEVLRIRIGERLRFAIDISSDIRTQQFPPMMLLTLVENAIKHGIDPSACGGTIVFSAHRHGNGFVVSVADTGVGFGAVVTGGTGVGLANTRSRLAALYSNNASLDLTANEPTGVVATVYVPQWVQPLERSSEPSKWRSRV